MHNDSPGAALPSRDEEVLTSSTRRTRSRQSGRHRGARSSKASGMEVQL